MPQFTVRAHLRLPGGERRELTVDDVHAQQTVADIRKRIADEAGVESHRLSLAVPDYEAGAGTERPLRDGDDGTVLFAALKHHDGRRHHIAADVDGASRDSCARAGCMDCKSHHIGTSGHGGVDTRPGESIIGSCRGCVVVESRRTRIPNRCHLLPVGAHGPGVRALPAPSAISSCSLWKKRADSPITVFQTKLCITHRQAANTACMSWRSLRANHIDIQME